MPKALKKNKEACKIAVLGGGLWGTVLAQHLARDGRSVWLWEFFPELARNLQDSRKHPHIPGFELAPSIRVTSDLRGAVHGAGLILSVLPSAHVRGCFRKLREILGKEASRICLINASKGVEPKSLKTLGEVILEEIPNLQGRVLTLSGPSFAREVARGIPTSMVLAGPPAAAKKWRRALNAFPLKVDLSDDMKGVELGGSLKNVLAIACGIVDGLKAGANTKAALMTQGLAEMGKVVKACGGKIETVYGLAGIGDFIATGTSPESRNRKLGELLGSGKSLGEALKAIPTVTEGVDSALSARQIVARKRLSCPLLNAVWQVLYQAAGPEQVLKALGFLPCQKN